MQAEMIATAYRKVQIDLLRDLISEIGIGRRITRPILNDGLNCITTLNLGNFQSDSRHLRLRYDSIQEAIAKGQIEIKHVAGTEMLADTLTKALWGVILSQFWEEIGLGQDHRQDLDFLCFRLFIWIMVGSTLYAWIFFRFGIWNLEEDLRFSFVSFVLFYFISKAMGQRGSVD